MMLKQFVPADFCLKCLGCCRFAQNPTIWAPSGCKLAKHNGEYLCENLKEEDNSCKIYGERPFDCRLYPFLLVRRGNSLQLGLHKACSFIQEKNPPLEEIQGYADYLRDRLHTDEFALILESNPDIAADYTEDVDTLAELLCPLTIGDKPLAEGYFKKNQSFLSSHHFASIFIWRDLFNIFWTVIENTLCIFYQDKIGMFMPLPPQGELSRQIVEKCFKIMRFYNQNSAVSRIENISEDESGSYSAWGYKLKPKDTEYLCLREDLANLSGDAFKHKRASCNYFEKNYKADVLEYNASFYEDCLLLYRLWLKMRKDKFSDCLYQQMLEDSFVSFRAALKFYEELGLAGYVVKINGETKACSFGYGLDKETFCVLFEVCDLNIKGIAQFIFREFCRKLSGYAYINVMGASDLENLKSVKLSYRPVKEIKAYTAYLPDGQ